MENRGGEDPTPEYGIRGLIKNTRNLVHRKSKEIYERLHESTAPEEEWQLYNPDDLPVPKPLSRPSSSDSIIEAQTGHISRKQSIKNFASEIITGCYDPHHVFFTP